MPNCPKTDQNTLDDLTEMYSTTPVSPRPLHCIVLHCQLPQLNRLDVTSSSVFSPTKHLDLEKLYYVFRLKQFAPPFVLFNASFDGEKNVDVNPCLILDFKRRLKNMISYFTDALLAPYIHGFSCLGTVKRAIKIHKKCIFQPLHDEVKSVLGIKESYSMVKKSLNFHK